mmetsp:Transcript_38081/g.91872  ORF Transcript_38081/g.91872 Transcript_38081/m.91872 type:complete len:82 (+) Transcript_38081:483-728(+)
MGALCIKMRQRDWFRHQRRERKSENGETGACTDRSNRKGRACPLRKSVFRARSPTIFLLMYHMQRVFFGPSKGGGTMTDNS